MAVLRKGPGVCSAPRVGTLAAVLLALLGGPAAGDPIHTDVAFQQNESDGRLSVHGLDFEAPINDSIIVDKRVFGRTMEESGDILFNDDPGFTSSINNARLNNATPPLDAVVGSNPLQFNVLAAPAFLTELGGRNLSWWNGMGSVSWSAVPAGEGIRIFDPSDVTEDITVYGGTSDVTGFSLGTANSSGFLHEHINFRPDPPWVDPPPVGANDGVYLLLMEGTYEPYAEWIPFYVMFKVFAGGVSTLNAAIADVEADLLYPLCSDGIDNDRDGLVDSPADPGCENAIDMSERGATAECDDGLDNDNDSLVDFPNDGGCTDAMDTTELPEPGSVLSLACGTALLAGLHRLRERRA